MKTKRPFWILSSAFAAITFAGVAQAVIVEFDISPPGTGAGVGLSSKNVLAPAVSNGSGNEISSGIYFDSDSETLYFTFGYGSAAGFSDLSGAATDVHLLYGKGSNFPFGGFASRTFTASPATKGGIVTGSMHLPLGYMYTLLKNEAYIEIHTNAYPYKAFSFNSVAELRGQLVRVNIAPTITCEPQITVEGKTAFTFNTYIADFDGDPMTAKFTLNGKDVKTVALPGGTMPATPKVGAPPAGHDVSLVAEVDDDTNLLTITATDSKGKITICDVIINAKDTVAPVITSLTATPNVLRPPNQKLVPITISAKVKDAYDNATYKIISINSSQPDNGRGDGNTTGDSVITGDHTAKIRAERSGKIKADRIYTIKVQATDEAGNKSAIKTVAVTVPKSNGDK